MKITYKQNPMKTTVELEPHDVELLRHKLMIEEMENAICYGWMHLNEKDPKWYDPKKARDAIDHEYWYSDKYKARIQMLLDHYTEELMGTHAGDCTCFPCSCSKCHAENMLGIDTIKGLGKHEGSKVMNYFRGSKPCDEPDSYTLDEVIAMMEKPADYSWESLPEDSSWKKSSFDKAQYEYHVPRWTQERANALAWLKQYRDEHFKGE